MNAFNTWLAVLRAYVEQDKDEAKRLMVEYSTAHDGMKLINDLPPEEQAACSRVRLWIEGKFEQSKPVCFDEQWQRDYENEVQRVVQCA
ncbi:MAG: hypothetical protein IT564_11480 [Rhodospirillales bacterium]|nr:hypothetical protein [Rhodospirillales bacterium]